MTNVAEVLAADDVEQAAASDRRSVERRLAANPGRREWLTTVLPGDVCAAALALSLAGLYTDWRYQSFSASSYAPHSVAIGLCWLLMMAGVGAYEHRAELFAVEETRRVARAAVATLAAVALPHFLFELDLSQRFVALSIPALVGVTLAWRITVRRVISGNHLTGQDQYRVLLCGHASEVSAFVEHLSSRRRPPIRIVSACITGGEPAEECLAALGGIEQIDDTVTADELRPKKLDLIVRVGQPVSAEMWELTELSHASGIPLALAPQRNDVANLHFGYLPLNGAPLLMVESPALKPAHRAIKSVLDRVSALVLLVLASPILVAVALVVALRDGRPVLYRQRRVGRDGREFEIVKFRTMLVDAHEMRQELHAVNEGDGHLFKVREDPRITAIGRRLRRYSLDELPQLWNVLRGEMSLVGPRPPLPSEVKEYDARTARRMIVKPGMTGLWQVEGRSDLSWDEGLYYDLFYVNHWSLALDVSILLRTVGAVVRPTGAY